MYSSTEISSIYSYIDVRWHNELNNRDPVVDFEHCCMGSDDPEEQHMFYGTYSQGIYETRGICILRSKVTLSMGPCGA